MAKQLNEINNLRAFVKSGAGNPQIAGSTAFKEAQQRVTIADLAKQLSPDARNPVRSMMGVALAMPSGPDRTNIFTQILSGLPGLIAQDSAAQSAAAPSSNNSELSDWLAQQALSTRALGQAQAAGIQQIIPNVPAPYQPMLQYDALNRSTQANQMADALVTSFRAQPLVRAFQAQIAAMGGGTQQPSLSGLGQTTSSSGSSAANPSSLYGSLTPTGG